MPSTFRPSSFLENPDDFGRVDPTKWRKVDDHEQPLILAAYLQHRLCYLISQQVAEDTAGYLAELLETPSRKAYLMRKLHGQLPITIIEMTTWSLLAGIKLSDIIARPD